MIRPILISAMMLAVFSVAGCASVLDPCASMECGDKCSSDTRLHGGVCVAGECMYKSELCEHGCSEGSCGEMPPHLVFDDDSKVKGGFRVGIENVEVKTGDKDEYVIDVIVTNEDRGDGIFSMKGASIVAATGIMHDSVGFSWSDFIESGAKRGISLRINDVPKSLREQDTTLVIRTSEGHFYFPARFES